MAADDSVSRNESSYGCYADPSRMQSKRKAVGDWKGLPDGLTGEELFALLYTIVAVIICPTMATDVICGLCNQHYDADVQMPVCPHLLIEDVERKRKAEAEDKLIKAKKK